jgi:hypothetical protein
MVAYSIFVLFCHPSNGFVAIKLAYIIAINGWILTSTIFWLDIWLSGTFLSILQFIIPTKSHLFKWKISTDRLCNVCKVEEDYDHFFMSCKYLDIFWNKINEMLKKVQFENNII